MTPWRVGEHYGIHVYEGDRPVATFHRAEDAERAVAAVNEQAGRDFGQLREVLIRELWDKWSDGAFYATDGIEDYADRILPALLNVLRNQS